MQENTKFILHSEPYEVKFGVVGREDILIDNKRWLPIDGYRKVCIFLLCVESSADVTFEVQMGRLSDYQLGACISSNLLLDGKIYCYDVIGPEMALVLTGKDKTTAKIVFWIYLIP